MNGIQPSHIILSSAKKATEPVNTSREDVVGGRGAGCCLWCVVGGVQKYIVSRL